MSSRRNQTLPMLERFQENLRHFIEASGHSQEEISYRASVHRTQITLILRRAAPRDLRVSTLVRIAGALEIEPYRLLEGVEWETGQFSEGGFKVSPSPKRLTPVKEAKNK